MTFTSAPLAIKDKIIIGAANGDQGVRDWIGGLDAKTGKRLWLKYTIPAPGEPGFGTTEMLFIDPLSCVDCGACVSACPVDAIVPHTELTAAQEPFQALNAA